MASGASTLPSIYRKVLDFAKAKAEELYERKPDDRGIDEGLLRYRQLRSLEHRLELWADVFSDMADGRYISIYEWGLLASKLRSYWDLEIPAFQPVEIMFLVPTDDTMRLVTPWLEYKYDVIAEMSEGDEDGNVPEKLAEDLGYEGYAHHLIKLSRGTLVPGCPRALLYEVHKRAEVDERDLREAANAASSASNEASLSASIAAEQPKSNARKPRKRLEGRKRKGENWVFEGFELPTFTLGRSGVRYQLGSPYLLIPGRMISMLRANPLLLRDPRTLAEIAARDVGVASDDPVVEDALDEFCLYVGYDLDPRRDA